jgi:hypothetical protein
MRFIGIGRIRTRDVPLALRSLNALQKSVSLYLEILFKTCSGLELARDAFSVDRITSPISAIEEQMYAAPASDRCAWRAS